jgi:putative zinc finger/helix-turn-helix YgiT family protein
MQPSNSRTRTPSPAAALHVRLCPSCRQGLLSEGTRERVFRPHGQDVIVELLTSTCGRCGAEAPTAAQHQENLQRLAARKVHYGDRLMGQEILALRRRHGLTLEQAARIFGKAKTTFSRYESEKAYPDESTNRLLALAMAMPEALGWLAERADVAFPLPAGLDETQVRRFAGGAQRHGKPK